MPTEEPLLRNLADTARWVAAHRARETARKDAHFRDPFAARLAGERGEAILRRIGCKNDWTFTARTVEFDTALARFLAEGADTVVNLAAGFDTRPYRMNLPSSLRWFELDLPAILEEKERLLAGETPVCQVERIPVDLADVTARRAIFERIGAASRRAVVLTEGLLIYLTEPAVASLSADLSAVPAFRHWVLDMVSPVLLPMIGKTIAKLNDGGVSVHFAPAVGPPFFEAHGWRVVSARSLLKAAVGQRRLGFIMRLVALLPDSQGRPSRQPWGGVCILEKP